MFSMSASLNLSILDSKLWLMEPSCAVALEAMLVSRKGLRQLNLAVIVSLIGWGGWYSVRELTAGLCSTFRWRRQRRRMILTQLHKLTRLENMEGRIYNERKGVSALNIC